MSSSLKQYLRLTSISLLLLTAINATVAGVLFIIDPSGHGMGMSVSYIKDSPFTSYLIPGIVLLIVNGFLNFIADISYLRKSHSLHSGLLLREFY